MKNWVPLVSLYILALSAIFMLGCSGGNADPVHPTERPTESAMAQNSHTIWGLWQFIADPEQRMLDVVQLKVGNMHVNVLPFLEPPPLVHLTFENLEFNGNIIDADIGLRHPFLGLDEFTGFDVCGVLIGNGSVTGFTDSNLRMAGDGDTRLLNPDGLTRWWNPAEFPVNNGTMFGYTDGLLGTPDSYADFDSTLNGYKYYCDDLSNPDDPLSTVDLASRGMFSPGQKNVRHFSIEIGTDGLIFNYAVDASWQFPQGAPPYVVPDDFAPGANKTEAWRADINNVSNSLWNDGSSSGGSLSFDIDLYDWFNAEMNTVYIESPGNFAPVGPLSPTGGGEGYSTYEVDITGATPQTQDSIDLLIIAECEASGYGGLLPGETEAAYFIYKPAVSSGGGIVCDVDVITPMPYTGWPDEIEFDASGSSGPGVLSYEWDFNDDGIFGDPYDSGTDENPRKCFTDNHAGDVCVRVSNGTSQVECCVAVDITILPTKNIQLRNVEAYDLAIDHEDGDLLVLYADGEIWKYELADWYQQGTDTKFGDLAEVCTYYDLTGLDYMDIAENQAVVLTGTSSNGWNRILFYDGDGDYIYGCNTVIGSSRTIFDAMAYVDTGEYHANTGGYASCRSWSGTYYCEMGMNMPPNYATWHWNTFSYPESSGNTGLDKLYLDYSVAVESDRDGDELWWLESDPVECYATRWHLSMNTSNPTYSYMSYDNAYFGTGTQADNDECWYDAKDICRDDDNRYFVLDHLSGGAPRVKVFDVTDNPGTSVGGFGDGTAISGDPLRIEGSDYDAYIVVMHGATPPQMISIFTECEIPE